MVLGRGRLGVVLLASAGIIFCMALLATPWSGAPARAAQSGDAVDSAGDDNCEDVEAEGSGTQQSQQNQDDNVQQQTQNGDQQAQGQNENDDLRVQNDGGGDAQQSSQVGDESGTGDTTSNDTTSNETTSEDGTSNNAEDNGDPTSDEATPNDTTPSDATSDDTEDNDGINNDDDDDDDDDDEDEDEEEEEECVIAESVPDELLPPTGVSANSQNGALAEKKENDSNRQNKHSTRDANSSDRNEKASERDGDQKKISSAKKSSSAEKQRSRIQQQQQQQKKKKKKNSGASKRKVEIKDRPSGKTVEVEDRSSREPPQEPPQESLGSNSKASSTPDPAPRLAANWSAPSRQEVASAGKLRRFAPNPAGSEMSMSVRALGLYEAPVASSGRPEDLDNGLIRMPQTDLPWDEGKEKNVYVAGHYLGVEGTNSRMIFYNLHKLKKGDEIALKDGLGQVYKYRVSEKFAAGAADNWAMGEVRNRDMLTLQTCIPPDFGKRLLVRADRVQPDDRT
jgi:sortase A